MIRSFFVRVALCAVVLFWGGTVSSFAADPQGYMPIGQTFTPQDVFGGNEKRVHPFLSVTGMYTDNFYNTKDGEKSELGAIISPGIWLALPGVEQPLLNFTTSTSSSGGLSYSRIIKKSKRRVQGYLSYRADIEQYTKESSENTENHDAEGLIQINLRSGLSVELMDKYVRTHDSRSSALTTLLDRYETNFANAVVDYDITKKFKVRLDYHNYLVDYDQSRNEALDRIDHSYSGYVFFKFAPKTSAFMQYENVTIDYDTDQLSDSTENRGYLGLDWDMTAKSWGRVKVGYGDKSMDDSTKSDLTTFLFETQLKHEITPKMTLMLTGDIGNKETNIDTTEYLLEKGVNLTLNQDFTRKVSGFISLHYTRDDYEGDLTYALETKERSDDIFSGSIGLDFTAYRWLNTSLSYVYTQRDSNFSTFDYTNNSVYLSFQVFM